MVMRIREGRMERKIKLAVVVEAFPVPEDPSRGMPVFHKLLELQHLADLKVYYCRSFRAGSRPPPEDEARRVIEGLTVQDVYFPAIPLLSRPFNGRECAERLIPLLERDLPDAILVFFAYPQGYAAVMAGQHLKLPVLLVGMGSDLRYVRDPFTRKHTRWAVSRADLVVTVSHELRTWAIALGASSERVRVVGNGCDPAVFHIRDRQENRRALGIAEQTQMIVFVGRLVALKGLTELIEAAGRLADTNPHLKVFCIGNGPYRQELLRHVEKFKMGDTVHFLGSLMPPDVARWLAACDVFCLPSHSEGSPNVIREALSCGRPVVSTDVGGIPELVDFKSGILVPPRNVEKLMDALGRALRMKWDEQLIASSVRRTWADMARDLYDEIANAINRASAKKIIRAERVR
jgi:teichuronic acid biosynthesis glycosyltransferase TuaC